MSVHIYPVTAVAPICDQYRVKINGEPVALNGARVSAVPFNRRWPGHQRPIDQTEPAQFLSFATDGPVELEIAPCEPFDPADLKIRPQSLGLSPTVTEDGRILLTLPRAAYFTVEPYGRRHALHVFADPLPTYAIDRTEENLIYFGAGEHDVGMIRLQSGQTLYLDEGAVVYGCVHAIDAQNIRILGRGILDNSRNREKILFEASVENNHAAVSNAERLHTVQLEYCDNVEIDGITIRDSLVYNIRPVGCSNLRIRHVKIIGCWRYNSDGIDMHNCVGVHISDCFLRTFDDSICVKGFDCFYEGDVEAGVRAAMYRNGKSYDVFRDVLVERCVIWNDWNKALEIGAETRAEEICDVVFRDCDLIHLTRSALDCCNVDYADVHHVCFEDIRIETDEIIPRPMIQRTDDQRYVNTDVEYMPDTITLSVVFHPEYSAGGERRGRNRDFEFRNINLLGPRLPKVNIVGYDKEHRSENIRIVNLQSNGKPLPSLPEENWQIGEYTSNICLVCDEEGGEQMYGELKKNTVSSERQLQDAGAVRFHSPGGTGVRVMFVGNSITLHAPKPEIGWYGHWGMAASAEEKDYVHLAERGISERYPDASFCICQVADWERQYKDGEKTHGQYAAARAFGADLLVVRLVENCPTKEVDGARFRASLSALLSYLDGTGKAKILLTTGFWRHPLDEDIRAYAIEQGLPLVELGDLGERAEMKATGLFAHKGVANHPGDLGMQTIADRIVKSVFDILE